MGDVKFLISLYAGELWKRRWSALVFTWVIAVIGILFVMSMPDKFSSRAKIYMDTEELLTRVLKQDVVTTDYRTQVENVRQLMYARPNIEKVIKKTDLDLLVNSEIDLERMVKVITENIQLNQISTNLYEIRYVASDADVAERVVQEVLQAFIEQNLYLDRQQNSTSIVFVRDQLRDLKVKLDEAELAVTNYRSTHIDELIDRTSLLVRMRDAESYIEQARLEKSLLEARRDQLSVQLSSTPQQITIGGGFDLPQRAQVDPQCQEMRGNLNALIGRGLTDAHPDVKAARRIVAEVCNNVPAAVAPRATRGSAQPNPVYAQLVDQLNSIQLQLSQMEGRTRNAEAQIPVLRDVLERQPAIQQELAFLESRAQQVFRDYSKAEEQLKVLENTEKLRKVNLIDYNVVEAPKKALTPIAPNRMILFMGVLIASIAGGVGITLVRVQLADNLPTTTHLRQAFDLPILGSVSQVSRSGGAASQAAGAATLLASFSGLGLLFAGLIYYYHFKHWRPNFQEAFDWIYLTVRSVV